MYSVIILAAGSGERAGLGFNKVLFHVHNQEILKYSIDYFNKEADCSQIILVVSEADLSHMQKEYSQTTSNIVIGGETRQKSVCNALQTVEKEYVLIHDGARPFLESETLTKVIDAALTLLKFRSRTIAIVKPSLLFSPVADGRVSFSNHVKK